MLNQFRGLSRRGGDKQVAVVTVIVDCRLCPSTAPLKGMKEWWKGTSAFGLSNSSLTTCLYLQTLKPWFTLTNKNSIQEETKSRLKLGNACYYSVQNLLSSSLLSKKLKIKIYRTIILPVVLYGCETWSLTLREGRRLRVFENRVLRRVFVPKRDEVTG